MRVTPLLMGLSLAVNVVQGQSVERAAADVNTFASQVYKKMADTAGNGNFVFSPLSLNIALRMVEAGARGNTLAEMARVVNPSENATVASHSAQRLLRDLESSDQCGFTAANSVWVDRRCRVLPAFSDTLKLRFDAACQNVDFSRKAAVRRSCTTINNWVKKHTNGKITNLIDDKMVNSDTRMVLVNAIHFKCDWAHKFKKSNNFTGPFHSIDSTSKDVTFMSQTRAFDYIEETDYKAVSLPYSDNRFALLIVMPTGSFTDFESGLSGEFLTNMLSNMGEERVALSLPKFKAGTSVDFTATLRALGIVEAMSTKADFSGITGRKDLMLSKVVQKAMIEVEESGTEAAAATAAAMMVKSAFIPKLIFFSVDHPFLYFIYDVQNNVVIFAGRHTMAQ